MTIPDKMHPYLDTLDISGRAVEAFHDVTGSGRDGQVVATALDRDEKLELAALLEAHSIASKEPSFMLEGLWEDGVEDMPPGLLFQMAVIDWKELGPEDRRRTAPFLMRTYRWASQRSGTHLKFLLSLELGGEDMYE